MKILVVDDNTTNRKVLRVMLTASRHQVEEAADGIEALEKLRTGGFDAVFADILMPRMDGYRFCHEVRGDPGLKDLPVIVYTSTYTSDSDEQLALSVGADSFVRKPATSAAVLETLERVVKNRPGRRAPVTPVDELDVLKEYSAGLVRKLEQRNIELEGARDRLAATVERLNEAIRQQKEVEEALRDSEERYRLLFEKNPEPMWVFDEKTLAFLAVNQAACRHYGYSHEEFLSMTIRDIRPAEDVPALLAQIAEESRDHEEAGVWRHRRKDGSIIEVEIVSDRLAFGGRVAQLVLAIDKTEKKQLELQLRQVQKMDAIGQLAGGIAHDFNNVLTAILGYGSLLAARLASDAPARAEVEEILRASERAAALTRQLLAFSRRQVLEPVVLSVNELITNLEKMLGRLIGENMSLVTRLDPSLGNVLADSGQLEQVIVNLVVNARDAMPEGGRLTIETANVELDDAYAQRHASVQPGRYVMVAVSDTGLGMDAETQARIFEPFFTTKAKGKGTGLGLSTVYGIVKQSGGSIWVTSEPRTGTTFKVYLPRVAKSAAEGVPRPAAVPRPLETRTVLVVEDEAAIRSLARRILERDGFRVLDAPNGREAEKVVSGNPEKIDVLLTDLVMPDMGGTELAKRLLAKRPDLRVVLMSGYTDDAVVRNDLAESGRAFLQKPFTPASLVQKVRDVLA